MKGHPLNVLSNKILIKLLKYRLTSPSYITTDLDIKRKRKKEERKDKETEQNVETAV